MLALLAYQHDQVARGLATRWAEHGVGLLTCADLSTRGWRWYPGQPERSRAVIGGERVALTEISGVLTRLPCVSPQEMGHMRQEDRNYAANEMHAFLLAWLADLARWQCPVLNPPRAPSLAGPNWQPEHWIALAARMGMPVIEQSRRVFFQADAQEKGDGNEETGSNDERELTVVGTRCLGTEDAQLTDFACRLARNASVELLGIRMRGSGSDLRFVSATTWPDLTRDASVEQAVLAYLLTNAKKREQRNEVGHDFALGSTRG